MLADLLRKYQSLEENIDEFLFEFARPYIEARLSPLYAEFMHSQEFRQMKKELRAGELFEWMLSKRET